LGILREAMLHSTNALLDQGTIRFQANSDIMHPKNILRTTQTVKNKIRKIRPHKPGRFHDVHLFYIPISFGLINSLVILMKI
jgi:hypothetical protein